MRVLLVRLDAPLLAFGGPIVDQVGVVQAFPGASMVTGLLGNALGWRHGDGAQLNRLQDRLRFAARLDRRGTSLIDFQTAELGARDTGWTTRGVPEGRDGGAGTYRSPHVRLRYYRADSVCTLAIALAPPDEMPTVDVLEVALREPARPLFIGRKACLPAAPLSLGLTEAPTLLEAVRTAPASPRADGPPGAPMLAQWPPEDGGPSSSRLVAVTDERDWVNQIHAGERLVREGLIHCDGGGMPAGG